MVAYTKQKEGRAYALPSSVVLGTTLSKKNRLEVRLKGQVYLIH
jgi:hypothetical protein